MTTLSSHIRSFVRRQGRITPSQQKALDNAFPIYGLTVSEQPLNFAELFGRDAPTIVEIGFGDGANLVQLAANNPQNNYIGIEVYTAGIGACLINMRKAGVENIRIINGDAVLALTQMIPECSLEKVLIFFPDPWHKKRHNKRRLIQPAFIKLLLSRLKDKGMIHCATDWEAYAEQMMEMFSQDDDCLNLFGAGNFCTQQTDRIETKFERRGLRLGHGVWDLVFAKK